MILKYLILIFLLFLLVSGERIFYYNSLEQGRAT